MMDDSTPVVQRTPVQFLPRVSSALDAEVWIKRDDLTHPDFGGNKIRKLVPLLRIARAAGAEELLTLGAAGSHHVLATAVHGRNMGFSVTAALVPHPRSPAALGNLIAAVRLGTRLIPGGSEPEAAARILALRYRLARRGRRAYIIPPGGTSGVGTEGYFQAGRELGEQIRAGEMPSWPDGIFCALGSGGTSAGLLAALRHYGAPSRLFAVRIYPSRLIGALYLNWLARRAVVANSQRTPENIPPGEKMPPDKILYIVNDELGGGYGFPTPAGEKARELFALDGIVLDPTYTAKAAAGLIRHARREGRGKRLLFWHTLSGTTPFAGETNRPASIDESLSRLLR